MKKRMTVMLSLLGLFVALVAALKFTQVRAAIAQSSKFQPPPEAVTTVVTREESWPTDLTAIGTVVAVHGVVVSADLPGIVDELPFTSGTRVAQGTVLARLDTRQEQAQLAAGEAALELTRANLERAKGLRDSGVLAQADYDKAVADHTQAVANVGQVKATIARKTIRAPFAGVLGIRQANLGQYLAAGEKIVPLQSLDPIYVNFSVPQQDVGHIPPGAVVRVKSDIASGAATLTGKVTAVDSLVDEATRNLQVQASFTNPDARLRPGMFVEAAVLLGRSTNVIALPASAISYAPFGDSVWVVSEMTNPKSGAVYKGVSQQFVKLGRGRGDQVAVVSGLKPGQEVVTSGVFKLRAGAAVEVNNSVQPGNDPAPKPQDS